MDSLLKQNELNVELVATVPGVLLFSFAYYQLSSYKRKTDFSTITAPMSRQFISIERILNRNINQSRLPLQDYGFVYLYTCRIRALASKFSTLNEHPRLNSDFTSDLNELNSVTMTPHQKFNTILRMNREYKFLNEL